MTIRLLKIPSRHLANFVEKGMGPGMVSHGKTWQDMALKHHYPTDFARFAHSIDVQFSNLFFSVCFETTHRCPCKGGLVLLNGAAVFHYIPLSHQVVAAVEHSVTGGGFGM